MKEEHIKNEIYNKLFFHLKATLLDKDRIEEMMEENSKLISDQKL